MLSRLISAIMEDIEIYSLATSSENASFCAGYFVLQIWNYWNLNGRF